MRPLPAAVFFLIGVSTPLVSRLEARITELVVISIQSPALEGRVFKSGSYRLLDAVAYGELAPRDRLNSVIVNLDKAPRNVRGHVEYSVDLRILTPIDLAQGTRTVFADIPNRGDMRALEGCLTMRQRATLHSWRPMLVMVSS
jgi:hypothetical protein